MNYKKMFTRGLVVGLTASTILLSNQLIETHKDNKTLLNELNAQTTKILELEANIEKIEAQNEALSDENKSLKKKVDEWTTLSEVKITSYCPATCCSDNWGRKTKSGTVATQGRTVAVDPDVIPLGSIVEIEGLGTFKAEDIGGLVDGKHIDVFYDEHTDFKYYKTVRYKEA